MLYSSAVNESAFWNSQAFGFVTCSPEQSPLRKQKSNQNRNYGKNCVYVTEEPQNGAIWGRDCLLQASVSVWMGPVRPPRAPRCSFSPNK